MFLTLPENEVDRADRWAAARRCASLLRELSTVGSVGQRIRHHGDLHLGQMLWSTATGS